MINLGLSRALPQQMASGLACFAVGILMCAIFGGAFHLWDSDGPLLWGAIRHALLISAICMASAFIISKKLAQPLKLNLAGFLLALLLYIASDTITSRYSFFPGSAGRIDLVLLSALAYLLILRQLPVLIIVSVLAPLLLIFCFLRSSSGALLFSDDSASVIYRLMLLNKHFPTLSHYNTLWNAGVESRDYLGTGSLNIFFISKFITLFSPIEKSYNYVVAFLVFVLAPFVSFRAALSLNLSTRTALFSALLSLAPSFAWWCWCFKYGALGFVTSAVLLPWVFAKSIEFTSSERIFSPLATLAYALVTILYLFWPLAGIALFPIAVLSIPVLPVLLRRRYFLFGALSILFITAAWSVVFWKISKVGGFVAINANSNKSSGEWDKSVTRHSPAELTYEGALKRIRSSATGANPILLFLGLPGILLLRKRVRIAYGSSVIFLAICGCLLAQLMPHFELERMLLLMLLILIVPTATALDHFIGNLESRSQRLKLALGIGWLSLCILVSAKVASNRSVERFGFADKSVFELSAAIQTHAAGGRTAFSGFVLHQFSGGHLAPLALLANQPLLTSAFTHSVWRYTDLIPTSFTSGGDEGIEEYFELMNVSLVAAHEANWHSYFTLHPDLYQEIGNYGGFFLFKRSAWSSTYFLEGKGEILSQGTQALKLKLHTPDALIKYNYLPILQSSACDISSRQVAPELQFIDLKNCPLGQEITISTRPIITRLTSELIG